MLRFILRREVLDPHSGARFDSFLTLDAEVPELEAALTGGGYGNGGFDHTKLHGVEVLTVPEDGERS